MNISPVSFYGIYNNKKPIKAANQQNTSSKKMHDSDKTARLVAAAGVLATVVTMAIGGCSLNKKANSLVIPFNSKKQSITEISNTYNVPVEAILAYNNIKSEDGNISLKELKIPASFDYIQPKIKTLQQELYSDSLSEEKRQEIENQIKILRQKKEEQDSVATVYKDYENVYITINLSDLAPEKYKEKYALGVNIETLKKLFDIEDGAIEKNNKLNAQWQATDASGENGYYDYTLNWFHNGDVIVVPLSSIKTNDINLQQYIRE